MKTSTAVTNWFLSRGSTVAAAAIAVASILAASCGDESGAVGEADVAADVETDATPDTDASDTELDAPDSDPFSSTVWVDLEEFLSDPSDAEDEVRIVQISDPGELIGGTAAQGANGDYLIENGHIRVIVEGDYRAMSPCPYGGNIIDSDIVRDDPDLDADVLGEVCLLVNAGLTLVPDEFEILADGSDGGAGILVVSGEIHFMDFLNLLNMAAAFLGPDINLNIGIQPNTLIPARVTLYYILEPGSTAVRVVSALRNDGEEPVNVVLSHILRPQGHGDFYNPLNAQGGFGYLSLGSDNILTDPVAFTTFVGDTSSFSYLPRRAEHLQNSILPIGATQFGISGVVATLLGIDNLVGLVLTRPDQLDRFEGVHRLEVGESVVTDHWYLVGDGSVASTAEPAYELLGVETGTLTGSVSGLREGETVYVSALLEGQNGMSQVVTQDGDFSMTVPVGSYTVTARSPGRFDQAVAELTGDGATVALTLSVEGTLVVNVRTPDDAPVMARVSIFCDRDCPNWPHPGETNIINDSVPGGIDFILPVGANGAAELAMFPGDYRVVVSRGMEWSMWPADAEQSGGSAVTIVAGQETVVDAEIAHVVDTSGVMSGDFHVHALSSTDSIIHHEARVTNFINEGVDVIVSTDHDIIFDFGPVVEAMGVEDEIVSIVGVEVTASDTGHVNGFPVEVDPDHRFGGALDWGRGLDVSHPPQGIYDWVHGFDGDQVMQINHPAGPGTIGALRADILLGTTAVDPAEARLPSNGVVDGTDDTGLWSDNFTAIEVMNGHSQNNFWSGFRWWLTMVGRGLLITSTAVTDTHGLHGDLGGSPRSFVFTSEAHDSPSTFDADEFVSAINNNRLVGSNGPFFRPWLHLPGSEDAEDWTSMGEVLSAPDGEIVIRVDIDVAAWVSVDTIDVYTNVVEDIYAPDGEALTHRLEPALTQTFELTEDDYQVVASGDVEHGHYTTTVQLELTVESDAYVVVVVRSEAEASMYPVVPRPSLRPFAWSNALYVDVDGGGYDDFPLAELAEQARAGTLPEIHAIHSAANPNDQSRHNHDLSDHMVWADDPEGVPFEYLQLTPELLGQIIDKSSCAHDTSARDAAQH